MANFTVHKLVEACREPGCPVCRLEQQSVERYLDNQFYENVNSPKWRDQLRLSLGFCREHAWLAVDKRLGDPLGFSIIYRDLVNSVMKRLETDERPARAPRGWTALLRQIPEEVRARIASSLAAVTPHKRCPVCEHRDEMTRNTVTVLLEELKQPEMVTALRDSQGVCLPHLRQALEQMRDVSVLEKLLGIQREKLESLRAELDEFIRKNDYQFAVEGFGSERDAWLRALAMVLGKKNE
ncbi:MAG TPA: DUF6062 family protein [Anaerolineales bacterium]|nr:DUF6062 family protein [Anaerolineales bacterium]